MTHCTIKRRVYYHDTDCGGVVYHANYLKFFEESRTCLFEQQGLNLKTLAEDNVLFVVKTVDLSFNSPARYGDLVEVASEIRTLGRSYLEFYQKAQKDGKMLVEGKIILVCVNGDFKPQRIPDFVCTHLRGG